MAKKVFTCSVSTVVQLYITIGNITFEKVSKIKIDIINGLNIAYHMILSVKTLLLLNCI